MEINIQEIEIITYDLINYYRTNLDKAEQDYKTLITNQRGLDKSKLTGYYEKHHIIPRCLGGLDEDSNYVLLTYREHILAHMLLYILHPEVDGLAFSFKLLIDNRHSKLEECYTLEVDLKTLEILKEIAIERSSLKRKEVREAIRLSQLGEKNNAKLPSAREKNRLWHLGRKDSPETRKKKSEASKRRNQKETYPESAKLKISEKNGIKVMLPDGKVFCSLTKASEYLGITRHILKKLIKSDSNYKLL